MSVEHLHETLPCALVDSNRDFVIGGQMLGFRDQLQTDLVAHAGDDRGAYLGIAIRLPREKDNVAAFFNGMEESSDLCVTIKWPINSFDISEGRLQDAQTKKLIPEQCQTTEFGFLQVDLRADKESLIDGIGFPFRGIDENIDGYVNSEGKIHGRWSPKDIFAQRTFYILVRDTAKEPMARFFEIASTQTLDIAPYGYVHSWSVERYRKQMSFENLKTHQSPDRFQFNGLNDALTVITQSTAQDCWWYAQDVHKLRTVKLPFFPEFLKRFARSADSLTLPWTELGIAFREPPPPDTYQDDGEPNWDDLCWSARVWPVQVESFERKRTDRATNNGGYFLLEVHRPRDPTSPAYRIRDHQIQAFPRLDKYEEEKKDIVNMLSKFSKDKMEEIYLSFHDGRVLSRRRVNATDDLFNSTNLAKEPLPDHGIGTEPEFSEDCRSVILQEFFIGRGYCHPVSEWHEFVSSGSDHFDAEYADMAISQLSPNSRDRFRQYIKLVSLGLVGICG
ncbi:hypothetical protein LX32DRAFT_730676 [Colletotrichum zoysiae]|uniref:Uncharacterized protein n=1 Tax=Colletotrichum zoysiae TaxID=1216348 RepID=A0AAD9HAT5_9PEZI|nr:hypothetical protein LX32DRAFT_730676 [Colletotrichum zoysiae]